VPSAGENAAAVWSVNPSTYGAATTGGIINTTGQTVANINTTTQNIFAVTA
jgi:hypothetical protein